MLFTVWITVNNSSNLISISIILWSICLECLCRTALLCWALLMFQAWSQAFRPQWNFLPPQGRASPPCFSLLPLLRSFMESSSAFAWLSPCLSFRVNSILVDKAPCFIEFYMCAPSTVHNIEPVLNVFSLRELMNRSVLSGKNIKYLPIVLHICIFLMFASKLNYKYINSDSYSLTCIQGVQDVISLKCIL